MTIVNPTRPDVERAKAAAWGGPFVLGLLLFVAGAFCFIAAGITSLASIFLFGGLLFAAGVLEIVYAFRGRKEGQFLLYFLAGLLSLVVGALFVIRPLESLAAVTLLLAGYFFASGLFRAITSAMDRYPRWGWDFFAGVVAVALGVYLFTRWPAASLWVVGVLVAAEIMARGIGMMAAALQVRRALHTATV